MRTKMWKCRTGTGIGPHYDLRRKTIPDYQPSLPLSTISAGYPSIFHRVSGNRVPTDPTQYVAT